MITVFDKLNLRPQERRLVVVAAAVLFVVMNVWLVRPKFGEWRVYQDKLREAERNVARFGAETNNLPGYEKKLEELKEQGLFVSAEDQPLALVQSVLSRAAEANVYVQRQTPGGGGAVPNNPFFEEQRVTISFTAGEKELVDFLVKLGSDNSLLRVRDLDLRPDPSQQKLMGNVTVIGRYPKKSGAKPGAPASPGSPRPIR